MKCGLGLDAYLKAPCGQVDSGGGQAKVIVVGILLKENCKPLKVCRGRREIGVVQCLPNFI